MILHGNQRGNARDLANHLTKPENERVEIHDLRGFASDTLDGAFRESYAISKGTKCKQHLYSLSINPPADAGIQPGHFVDAADHAEKHLGLDGQPRAIVFHDKRGEDGELRRHAHAVWCRIDPDTMTAKQMSFDREKLREVSRELHIKHGLKMPPGLINSKDRNPSNFSLEEWQQCKRAKKDPKQVKEAFQDCWTTSDSKAAFSHALEERGYILAQGRRGHVAVDFKGEKYPVSRYVGIKAKEVRARLGEADGLPTVQQAQDKAAAQIADRLKELQDEQQRELQAKRKREAQEQKRLREKQAQDAIRLKNEQTKRMLAEQAERDSRLRRGLPGFWDRITGKRQETLRRNALEAEQTRQRDEKQALELKQQHHLKAEHLQKQAKAKRRGHEATVAELKTDIQTYAPKPKHDPPGQKPTDQRSYIDQQRTNMRKARQNQTRAGPRLER